MAPARNDFTAAANTGASLPPWLGGREAHFPRPAKVPGSAVVFLLQSRRSLGPGGRAMYPKQLNPGVEMGAEVSLHWGSATLQGPSPSEAGRAWTLAS